MMTETPDAPPQDRVAGYFTAAAESFDTFYDGKRGPFMRWVDRRFRADVYVRYAWTFEEIGDAAGKTILDIGCGSGPYCVEAARRGAVRVVGIDIAAPMLELARRRAVEARVDAACEFIHGAFPHDAPDEVFDHVIATGVMDYVADAPAFIRAAARRVRRSAIISLPSIHWLRTPLRRLRYKIKRCPVHFYRPDEIREWMEAAGFDPVHLRKVPGAGQDYVVVAGKPR